VRGSPLLRALFAFLAILSLGYPLWRLTSADEAVAVAPPPPAPATAREITLQLTFSAPPKNVRVLHLGQAIWSDAAPAAEMERKVQLIYPKEGIDLQFQAEFSAGAPHVALRVKLTDPDGNEGEKSLWGAGSIDEVLTFP
jgi:hypothetical protein